MRQCSWVVVGLLLPASGQAQQPSPTPPFQLTEVMVPVRDGVRLQTVILAPTGQTGPPPILFRRTPYGVPDKPPEEMPPSMKELAQDGYIFVIQNLRGRFKSDGVFGRHGRRTSCCPWCPSRHPPQGRRRPTDADAA